MAHGILRAGWRFDLFVRRYAHLCAIAHAGENPRYAAPSSRALRLPQYAVLSRPQGLRRQRQILFNRRRDRRVRLQGPGCQTLQRARPILLRQRPQPHREPAQRLIGPPVYLHHPLGDPSSLPRPLRARCHCPRRRTRHRARDERIPAPTRHGQDGL